MLFNILLILLSNWSINFFLESIKGTKVRNLKPTSNKVIQLKIGNASETDSPEGYTLNITTSPDRVEIIGNSVAGVFNGIQSLFSLLAFGGTIPTLSITDEPRFQHRGLLLDVARNFFPKSTIIKILEVMALFKLNKLQLNLADDEGWRLDIEKLPELAKVKISRGLIFTSFCIFTLVDEKEKMGSEHIFPCNCIHLIKNGWLFNVLTDFDC